MKRIGPSEHRVIPKQLRIPSSHEVPERDTEYWDTIDYRRI